jgi:acyl-CoA ligase (AMP-forming) (exosortase A-associated)
MNRSKHSPHVLIIVENLPVPLDRRVWLECQALIGRGYQVSVICPKGPGDPARQRIDGVDIYKYKPAPEANGTLGFIREFAYSWLCTGWLSLKVRRRRRIDIIQACNPPDSFWLLALLWRPFGVAFVFDHHDLNPELFISRFGEPRGLLKKLEYRGLLWLERASFRTADRIISTNESYKAIAVRRGGRHPDEVTVVRSGPDTRRMRPIYPDRPRAADEINLVYLGIMGPQDGVDQVLLVVDELVHRRGRTNVSATLLGFGDCLAALTAQATALGLDGHVTFTGRVDKVAIAEHLSRADVGLCPDLKTPLNDLSTMNKTMEYMAYGLPAVSFDLIETRVSGGDALLYVPSGDISAFADAVESLMDDPALRASLGGRARTRVATLLDWRPQAEAYLSVYDDLSGMALPAPPDTTDDGRVSADRDPEGRLYVDLDDAEELDRFLRERSKRVEWSDTMMPARTSLHDLLSQAAAITPDAPALSYRNMTVSYAETWRMAGAAAAQLLALGLAPGDRVAIYLEKRLETVASIFGVSAAEGVFVPVNHVLKAGQVGHILVDSGAEVLITSADRLSQLALVLSGTRVAHVIVVDDVKPDPAASWQIHSWAEGQRAAASDPRRSRAIDIDPAAILYTSGSTGPPKGVVLSHRNLIVGAESVTTYLENTSADVILSVLPLSFDAGLSQVTTAFSVGAHCVLMNYLLPREVPRLCAQYGVTGLTCVPPLWLALAELDWPEAATRRMRYWANTGGRMPRATLDRLRRIFRTADPFLMYGLTEAFRSTYLDPAEVDRRPDSIGKAIPNAEVLVLRPDGTPCAPGEEGELVHRGALVALGYWNDPVRTDERYRLVHHREQEWRAPERAVWSGDTVVADDEGFLYFVGRTDDMIKTSGYRVSPSEIEEAAHNTGLVRDAVAIGVDDASLGQRIVLLATPAAAELDVAAFIAALKRTLPLYQVPSRIVVRDELHRSPNGKYDRTRLLAELTSEVTE